MNSAALAFKISNASQEPDGSWKGSCPVPTHGKGEGDRSPSFTWRDGDVKMFFKCWAGCTKNGPQKVLKALGLTEDDLRLDGTNLVQVSKELGIPVSFLESLGCVQDGQFVKVPYRNLDGSLARRYQVRHSRTAKVRFTWDIAGKGSKGTLAYGLWRLAEMRNAGVAIDPYLTPYLFLVEGASDCWSAWLHDEPCLGLPGATQARLLQKEHFDGYAAIYLVREPGAAGDTFVEQCTARLRTIGYQGYIWDCPMPDGKDLNEVLVKYPERDAFKDRLKWACEQATPIMIEEAPLVLVAEPVNADPYGREKFFEHTPLGNRDRMIDLCGSEMAYAAPGLGWLDWDGTRWRRDSQRLHVSRRAEATVRTIKAAAKRLAERAQAEGNVQMAKDAEVLLKWYRTSARRSALNEMLDLAEHSDLLREAEDFDAKPMLFNAGNKTIDLTTGLAREHRKTDLLTYKSRVIYNPAATCPRWEQFISEVMCGDAEMIGYLQRLVGYGLTGDTTEDAFFIFYGLGSNGKTTFLEVIRALLGTEYAKQTPPSTFLKKISESSSGPSPEIARLKACRLVTAVEVERAARLATGMVKAAAGGDRQVGRHLYQDLMEFDGQYKVILSVNNKPEVADQSKGMKRRIHLVEWDATFEPGTTGFDPMLDQKLMAELPGILNWALAGVAAWRKQGLNPPRKVRAATEEYMAEQDELREFILESCVLGKDQRVPQADLFIRVKAWWSGPPLSKTRLTSMLAEKGIKPKDGRVKDPQTGKWKTATIYYGIGLKGAMSEMSDLSGPESNSPAPEPPSPGKPPRPPRRSGKFPLGSDNPDKSDKGEADPYLGGRR